MEAENRKTILFAFGANLLIALAKLAGGIASGSSALLSEAAHSTADCLNQVFLLVSLSLGTRRPDEDHPFGHGKERFFWALMAAVMIFVGGAIFSVVHGILALRGGAEHDLRVAFVVLAVALVAESVALGRAVRHVHGHARTAGKPVTRFVRDSRDPTIKVVLAEDSAALAGVVVALAALALVEVTHDPMWDGLASIVIGLILALVAYTIGRDAKRLLIGEAATAGDRRAIEQALAGHPSVLAVSELLTMQLGPEDILVAARLELTDALSTTAIERVMDELQGDVRRAVSAVQQVFIDPTPAVETQSPAAAAT